MTGGKGIERAVQQMTGAERKGPVKEDEEETGRTEPGKEGCRTAGGELPPKREGRRGTLEMGTVCDSGNGKGRGQGICSHAR